MEEVKKRGRPPKEATQSKMVKMKHRETGKTADVHESMVAEYRKGEYELVN